MEGISVLIGKAECQQHVINSAISIAARNNSLLSLILMPRHHTTIDEFTNVLTGSELQALIDQRETEQEAQLNVFRYACEMADVRHEEWQPAGDKLENLLLECIYSDLLILAAMELQSDNTKIPGAELRRLLEQVKCPLLLLPDVTALTFKTVFLYDGSSSAVYAFKMFCYLMPEMMKKPLEIVQVTDFKNESGLTESKRLTEFIACRCTDVKYTVLHGNVVNELHKFLAPPAEQALIVLGAYGRSRLSRWLHSSLADVLLRIPGYSIFIAHY